MTSSHTCVDPGLGWVTQVEDSWTSPSPLQSLHMAWASTQHGSLGVVRFPT